MSVHNLSSPCRNRIKLLQYNLYDFENQIRYRYRAAVCHNFIKLQKKSNHDYYRTLSIRFLDLLIC